MDCDGNLKFVVPKFVAFILPPAQRLRVLEKFKLKLQEEAKEKAEISRDTFHGNKHTGKLVCSPNGEHTKKIHTDKELAKMAGVGTGTVARYNQIIRFL